MKHSQHFALSGVLDIASLWIEVARLAQGRVDDNKLMGDEYPLEVREHQMVSLKTLVDAIDKTHQKMVKISNARKYTMEDRSTGVCTSRDTDLSISQVWDMTDFNDDEAAEVYDMKVGDSRVFSGGIYVERTN